MKAIVSLGNIANRFTYFAASRWLLNAAPSVYFEPAKDGLIISTECLEAGDAEIVGNQLRKLFDCQVLLNAAAR